MPEHAPDYQAREFAAAFREFLDWIHSSGTEEGNEVSVLVRDSSDQTACTIPW